MGMSVLAVLAHPDDESFFVGGLLATHAQLGDSVSVAVLADGEASRFDRGGDPLLAAKVVARNAAFLTACDHIGAKGYWLSTFPDQQADTVPQLTINRAVEALMKHIVPQLVYTHHVGDLNIDHRRVAEAVLVATRGGPSVRCVRPEWPDRCVGPRFDPTVRFRLNEGAVEAKVRACLCYADELRPYPHPRSEQAIREEMTEAFMEIA